MKIHAKFGSPRPYTVGQENIQSSHNINLCKTYDPLNGASFDSRAII